MLKLLKWLDKHILEILVGFLLIFIPLYPKFPLIDIKHTWVYIRLEDFFVALTVGIWLIQLARKKVSLKTPLTIPIFLYWLAGGISLVHAILILAPRIPNFFPHLALFHYLRRIEYMVLFFVAAATVRDLRTVYRYLGMIGITLFLVCIYGFGQKFFGFPAFLTMNEEFAKGLPLYLPPTARMTSTFAGHYDLAAFLIFMIAIWGSLIFGFKNWLVKIFTLVLVFASFMLLLFTASRISFTVYLLAVSLMLFLQKKKWLILPVVIVSLFLSQKVTGSAERFAKTLRVRQVVYDTRTGLPVAAVEEFFATPTPTPVTIAAKSPQEPSLPTPAPTTPEENLPLGSGYFSLEGLTKEEALAQIIRKPIFAKSLPVATMSSEIATTSGEFLIKRAIVYDISFTTRIQGEWPKAIEAFKRNRLLGSGFSSISLATDNDYLRLLGETGLAGFFSFLGVLATFTLLLRLGLKKIKIPLARSILIGGLAGIFGLLLNAILIDVFEASKVAYTFWMVLGIIVGLIQLLLPEKKNLFKEAIEVATQPLTMMVFLCFLAPLVFGSALNNYFTGDDFTWLRWAFSHRFSEIPKFFVSAEGFFYRPLAKAYFLLANPFFGLRPFGYRLVSLLFHLSSALGVFLVILKIAKSRLAAFLASLFFLVHPINAESVFWISTTSHLFAGFFYIWGFLSYITWRTSNWRGKNLFFVLTFLAYLIGLACHEMMVTFPLVLVFYDLIFSQFKKEQKWYQKISIYLPFGILLNIYFWLRNFVAKAHGLSGDYNYNLKNFPFNFVGNLTGYFGELLFSFHFIPVYDALRNYLRTHKFFAFASLLLGLIILLKILKRINFRKLWLKKEFKLVTFAFGWFIIVLLPFVGLGNIAERYLHTAQLGFFLILGLAIEKIYEKIKKVNFKGSIILVLIISLCLTSFYLTELEKAKKDWYEAGEIANKILLALPTSYIDFPSGTDIYFVNLPLRLNRAWVFPVGIKDGVWFIYRNDSIRIFQMNDLDQALDLAEGKTPAAHVFLYYQGELTEVKR